MILQAVVGGFVLDALFGDPAWLPHPVVLMGRCISRQMCIRDRYWAGTPLPGRFVRAAERYSKTKG